MDSWASCAPPAPGFKALTAEGVEVFRRFYSTMYPPAQAEEMLRRRDEACFRENEGRRRGVW